MYRKVKQKQVKKFELNKERENIMKMLQKSAVMRGTDNMVIKEIPVPQIKIPCFTSPSLTAFATAFA